MKEVNIIFILAWKFPLPGKNATGTKGPGGWEELEDVIRCNFETLSWAFGPAEASRCSAHGGKVPSKEVALECLGQGAPVLACGVEELNSGS